MRRGLWILVLVLLLAACGAALGESADFSVPDVVIAVEPDALEAPADVTLIFTLTNRAESVVTNITLTAPDGLTSEALGDLAPGDTLSYERTHFVTEAELGAGAVSYLISCDVEGQRFSFSADAPLTFVEPKLSVDLLRQIASLYVEDGKNARVIYRIENNGTVPVYNLTLADTLGEYVEKVEALSAGESVSLRNETPITEIAVSSVTLNYAVDPDSNDFVQVHLDEEMLRPVRAGLTAELSAERSASVNDAADVTLRLLNVGNTDIIDIAVYDDLHGGILADSLSLAVNEPLNLTQTRPIRGADGFRWRVEGKAADGETLTLVTNTATAPASDSIAALTMSASTEMSRIRKAGRVPITLTFANAGSALASKVVISEEALGELHTFTAIPAGETAVYSLEREVSETQTLQFTAEYTDADGSRRALTAAPLTITIASDGVMPIRTNEEPSLFEGFSIQFGRSPLYMSLLIGAIVVLIALSVTLLVTSRRVRRARKEREAARKQRGKPENASFRHIIRK